MSLAVAVAAICPLIGGGLLSDNAQHNNSYTWVGGGEYRMYVENPTPYPVRLNRVGIVIKRDNSDSPKFDVVIEKVPEKIIPPRKSDSVTFLDDRLNLTQIVGSYPICELPVALQESEGL